MISSGDMGTSASTVEKELSDTLALATHWNAILVIDEADVFLEQRSAHDLKRNSMVSGKSSLTHLFPSRPDVQKSFSVLLNTMKVFSFLPRTVSVLSMKLSSPASTLRSNTIRYPSALDANCGGRSSNKHLKTSIS